MKKIVVIFFASAVAFTSCKKIKEVYKPGDPTYSIKVWPADASSGSPTVTFTDKDCKFIQAQAVSADGQTAITIVGMGEGGGTDFNINLVVQGSGVGIYADYPIASMSGSSPRLSSDLPFECREEDNLSIELLQFDPTGGRVKGTVNATCLHTISYEPTIVEELYVNGTFNVKRN